MIVKLNDVRHEVAEGVSLAAFLERLGIQSKGVAVAIDYQVIPKDEWEAFVLTDGQELMLIHAVSGG